MYYVYNIYIYIYILYILVYSFFSNMKHAFFLAESCIILPHCIWVRACSLVFVSEKELYSQEHIYKYIIWQLE